jgi:hypothetical protein
MPNNLNKHLNNFANNAKPPPFDILSLKYALLKIKNQNLMNLIRLNKLLFAVSIVAMLYSCRKDFSVQEKIDPASDVKNT